jgi:hypothetical protein
MKAITNNNILPFNDPRETIHFGKMENRREFRTKRKPVIKLRLSYLLFFEKIKDLGASISLIRAAFTTPL